MKSLSFRSQKEFNLLVGLFTRCAFGENEEIDSLYCCPWNIPVRCIWWWIGVFSRVAGSIFCTTIWVWCVRADTRLTDLVYLFNILLVFEKDGGLYTKSVFVKVFGEYLIKHKGWIFVEMVMLSLQCTVTVLNWTLTIQESFQAGSFLMVIFSHYPNY